MTEKSEIDLLYEAAEIANFDASKGWPEELEWWQFYSLMLGYRWLPQLREPQPIMFEYPDGRIEQKGYTPDLRMLDSPETMQRRRASGILGKMMNDASLEIEERVEAIPQPPMMVLSLRPAGRVPKEQPPEIKRRFVVTKPSARDCLKRIRKTPPEYVRAWLEPAWGTKAEKVGTGDIPKESKGRIKLRALLQKIEGLDPTNMPGRKIDFHALAWAYSADFRHPASTFDGYIDKPAGLSPLCTFVQGGARDSKFYREAGGGIGVNAVDYDRALKELEKQKASAKAKKGNRGS